MKRSPLDRKSGLKTGSAGLKRSRLQPVSAKRRAAEPDAAEIAGKRAWLLAGMSAESCACCGWRGLCHGHHAVRAQDVRKLGGDVWDLANRLPLHPNHHLDHHHGGERQRLRLEVLRPENLAFACELLGAERAEEYLAKHYRRSELDSSDGRA